jgi:hypothetical protein
MSAAAGARDARDGSPRTLDAAARARAGLCGHCAHARVVISARGSAFWRCARAEREEAYPKYPRLPVLRCAGHEESDT